MRGVSTCVLLAAGGIALACSEPTSPGTLPLPALEGAPAVTLNDRLQQVIARGGLMAEGTYLACLQSHFGFGLPLREIQALCAASLDSSDVKGWGATGRPFQLPENTPPGFDPNSVTAACGAGNPALSGKGKPDGSVTIVYNGAGQVFYVGDFTWGGKGESPSAGYEYLGLTERESEEKKLEAARELVDRYRDYTDAKKAAEKDPKNAQLQEDLKAAEKAMVEAAKKARKDPNLAKKETGDGGVPNARTTGTSTCQTVLQVARELFAECHRTGWKATECQQLHARMNGCPDPTLIHVDPEAGYACASPIDPQVVIDAWRSACERNTTPGPDGTSPCTKPDPSESGRTMQGDEKGHCGDEIARTDPETDGCIQPFVIDDFGRTDPLGLILWGQGVFGGPIVVLPLPKPPIVIKG